MRVAGVMSGTSLDGIDVAIVDIGDDRKVATIAHTTTPYPDDVRAAILAVTNTTTTTAAISRLNFALGDLYAEAIERTGHKVELIGCHGQTIYHEGGRNTMQIGEAAVIAERLGVPVVGDFRVADIAAGGQGAPLVPFVDQLLFRDPAKTRIALNIGGIANISVIPPDGPVIAFDTGPGNMVIDALAAEATGGRERFDRDGLLAAKGRVHKIAVDNLLQDPYYAARPPKSCGREQYGAEFVAMLKRYGGSIEDGIATATALTAATIANAIIQFGQKAGEVIVSGGGVHNPQVMSRLAGYLPGRVIAPSSDHGVDPDAKEAIAFAILAHETWHKRPSNLPSATGARGPRILGKVSYA